LVYKEVTLTQNNTIDNVVVKKNYYRSGALWDETPYVNGKMHGIEKWYYESGALRGEIPYLNGDIHGIEKLYYESGALSAETPYVNGKAHGIVKCYDEDKSNIDCLALYDKGLKVASVKFSIKGDRS
jgi:antitoxin component YwqK of YwqJK toxin-antitoxin module